MIFNDGVSIVSDGFRCVSLVAYCRGGFFNSCYPIAVVVVVGKSDMRIRHKSYRTRPMLPNR